MDALTMTRYTDPNEYGCSASHPQRWRHRREWCVAHQSVWRHGTARCVFMRDRATDRDVHTIGGRPIGPDNPGHYGRTHDFNCPGCIDTPYTISPRSETYWAS